MTYEANLLDETNLRILGELREDGRLGLAELGRRIGLSAPAVAERVQRLERASAIRATTRSSTRQRSASLWPRSSDPPVSETAEDPRDRPRDTRGRRCHRITGEDCYLLHIHLRSIDDLEAILDRFTPADLTTTSIIHSTPVPRRGAR